MINCAMRDCDHNDYGFCKLSDIDIDDDLSCGSYETKQIEFERLKTKELIKLRQWNQVVAYRHCQ